jgi:hypothetical protein
MALLLGDFGKARVQRREQVRGTVPQVIVGALNS